MRLASKRVQQLEEIYKHPNPRYAVLTSGEIVLLELQLGDGSFICSPEYFKYIVWPLREQATIKDVWERPITIPPGGSNFDYDADKPLEMLDPMNLQNYRTGVW